jgi:hypothetical protein
MADKRNPGRKLTPDEQRLRNDATHVAVAAEDVQKLRKDWLSADAEMLKIHQAFKAMEFVRTTRTEKPGTPEFLDFLDSHAFLVSLCTRVTAEACQVGEHPGVFTLIAKSLMDIWGTLHKQDEENRAELARRGIPAPSTMEVVGEGYRRWRNEPR